METIIKNIYLSRIEDCLDVSFEAGFKLGLQYKKPNIENLKQMLLEAMADYLNQEEVIFEMSVLRLKEDGDDLHIRMAKVAFECFENNTYKTV